MNRKIPYFSIRSCRTLLINVILTLCKFFSSCMCYDRISQILAMSLYYKNDNNINDNNNNNNNYYNYDTIIKLL